MTVIAMHQRTTDILLPLAEVRHRTRLSKHEIETAISDGTFPAPVRSGDAEPQWREAAIDTWIANLPRAPISWRLLHGIDADGWPE